MGFGQHKWPGLALKSTYLYRATERGSMDTMASQRLNITIPAHFDDLLGELAELSGRSKASFVLDALAAVARHWQDDLERLRGISARQAEPDIAEEQVMLPPPAMSRQQRRRLERAQRKREGQG